MAETLISPTMAPRSEEGHREGHNQGTTLDESAVHGDHRGRLSPFWRHFLEMLAAMTVGMIATGAIFLSLVGLKTWDEVTTQYPTQALLAMAAGMTIPMVAWMLYRGMGRRNSYEMAAAMVIPVIPFLCLVWFDVTESAQCAGYCASTIVAMLVLMHYRREQYSNHSMHAM
jgi:flagellar biosynthetic protein FliP